VKADLEDMASVCIEKPYYLFIPFFFNWSSVTVGKKDRKSIFYILGDKTKYKQSKQRPNLRNQKQLRKL